ncbi:related to BNR/Asp-box repeat domain protein [Cephalotrichum gorgonifer]|uniref:Related to BNR/Asp-box repeat domain protein n=1 Tax=Cephalotrichum gorgonifer TaxID=2041049 RepID=A0AAE8MY72_9PEZI|nr:related to BNR/Asp-box repeat domain protein [Cephalotrichum gorgonifer]
MVHLAAAVVLLAQSTAVLARTCAPRPFGFFTNNTIYQPVEGESFTYPRFTELSDGTILATSSVSGHTPAYFPIFESTDGGASWEWVSDVKDTVNGWGFPAQPALAELTEPLGGYEAGTILASGNSWSENGTRIDLYASTDKARTWEFVSHIAEGGRPNTTNGATPIWEPYLLTYDGALVAYYSDQRDPEHGQKLSHQVSKDLKNWEDPVDDVAYDEYIARPGMTVVAHIPPIDKWIVVYEFPVGNSSSHGVNYPVYYRLADSPLDFRLSEGLPIVINGTTAPNASPYVTWSPVGGKNGTIIVSDADRSVVYTNRAGGDVDKWEEHETPAGAVYSRAIHILKDHPDHLMIFGGETFDNMRAGLLTPFSATVVNLNKVLKDKYAKK